MKDMQAQYQTEEQIKLVMEVQLKDGVIWTISNKITDGVGILEASTLIGPSSEEVLANNTSLTTTRTKTTTTTNQQRR